MSEDRNGANDGTMRVRFSDVLQEVKAELSKLSTKIDQSDDKLSAKIDTVMEGTNIRLSMLENRMPYQDSINKTVEHLRDDFTGFETRFQIHEKSDGHKLAVTEIPKLQAQIQTLEAKFKSQEAVDQAITTQMRENRVQRNWFITITVGGFASWIGIAIALIRVIQGN